MEHASEAIREAASQGVRPAYVTNNASRSPVEVADQLRRLGLTLADDDVVTSAQAAADLLAGELPAGAPVLVVGSDALAAELEQRGLRPVREDGPDVVAVVQGHDPQTAWPLLAEATVALRRGVRWVAANEDRTLPSPRGPLPGNGAMVAALRAASDRVPEVAGKPEPPLLRTALARTAAKRALFVGDRIETDVVGAVRAEVDVLLVLTGVEDLTSALRARPGERPSYVGADLRALSQLHPPVEVDGETSRCAQAAARCVSGRLEVTGTGTPALRAACALAWSLADAGTDTADLHLAPRA